MTPAERDLVAVARALFEPGTAAMVGPVLRRKAQLPEKWSRRTMRALQDILRKGLVRLLARSGASSGVSFDEAGELREGRAWERISPPALVVGAASLRTLTWMVEAELGSGKPDPMGDLDLGFADEIVLGCAAQLLAAVRLGPVVAAQPLFRKSPFVWWVALDVMAGEGPLPTAAAVERWATGAGADLLGCLAEDLAQRWSAQELRATTDPKRALVVAAARAAVLEPLVARALAENRPDACAFLLTSLARWIPPESAPFDLVRTPWTRPLDPSASLAVRTDARRSGLASVRATLALAAAADRARRVGFVDEDWDQAQRMVRFYARFDEGRFARAETLRAHVEGLSWEEPS